MHILSLFDAPGSVGDLARHQTAIPSETVARTSAPTVECLVCDIFLHFESTGTFPLIPYTLCSTSSGLINTPIE